MYFEVLNREPRKQVGARSRAAKALQREMVLPIQIQMYRPWCQDLHADTRAVFRDAGQEPEVVDVMALAPWPVIRYGLRCWDYVGPSDTSGCLEIRHRGLASDVVDRPLAIADDISHWPLLLTLESLQEKGWHAGSVTWHSLENLSEKRLRMRKGYPSMKHYFWAILHLDEILGRAVQAEGISASQCNAYYQCLLQFPEQHVPHGLRSAVYHLALKDKEPTRLQNPALAIEGPGEQPALADLPDVLPSALRVRNGAADPVPAVPPAVEDQMPLVVLALQDGAPDAVPPVPPPEMEPPGPDETGSGPDEMGSGPDVIL